ncbi:MAG: Crp/Fnr family transcriptional regulator [Deltaproteobacteria bacterium]
MPIPVAARLAALKKVPLFADLEPGELEILAAAAVPRHFEPGEMIFSEGEPCEGLYVVESGEVKLFKISASGREQVLTLEGPGGSIAELPVFDGGNYPASASADKPSDLVFVRKKDLRALCMEHPEVALKVLKVVSGRLRRLVGIVEQLSFSTVHRRLVAYLLKEARDKGKRTARGVEFDFGMNNQELAAHIGTVRELVSRNLSRLQASKLIKLDGRTVVVLDLDALEAAAQNE